MVKRSIISSFHSGLTKKRRSVLAFQASAGSFQFILVRSRRQATEVLEARSVSLGHDSEEEIVEHLSQVLREHRIRNPDVVVALSRQHVDLVPLTLPMAADAELPALVKMQLVQQVSDIADGATIDFLPLDSNTNAERRVMACSTRNQTLDWIRSICEGIRCQARRISVRPLAAVELSQRGMPMTSRTVLVTPQDDQADINIIRHGRLSVARSVRHAGLESEASASQVAADIQRSLLVQTDPASDDSSVETVADSLVVFGDCDECESEGPSFATRLANALGVPLELANPFRLAEWTGNLPASEAGAFAPLVGLIEQHLRGEAGIDFVHPRQVVQPARSWRRYAVYATAASLLLLATAFHLHGHVADANSLVDHARRELAKFEALAKKLQKKQNVVVAVHQWRGDNVVWLDELRDFAYRFPKANDAILEGLQINSGGNANSSIALHVRVRDPSLIEMLENNLRDEFHVVQIKGVSEQERTDDYRWQFDSVVRVRPRQRTDYVIFEDGQTGNIAAQPPKSNPAGTKK